MRGQFAGQESPRRSTVTDHFWRTNALRAGVDGEQQQRIGKDLGDRTAGSIPPESGRSTYHCRGIGPETKPDICGPPLAVPVETRPGRNCA